MVKIGHGWEENAGEKRKAGFGSSIRFVREQKAFPTLRLLLIQRPTFLSADPNHVQIPFGQLEMAGLSSLTLRFSPECRPRGLARLSICSKTRWTCITCQCEDRKEPEDTNRKRPFQSFPSVQRLLPTRTPPSEGSREPLLGAVQRTMDGFLRIVFPSRRPHPDDASIETNHARLGA